MFRHETGETRRGMLGKATYTDPSYRWLLRRAWTTETAGPLVLPGHVYDPPGYRQLVYLMLNPSTGSATHDDATLTRCLRFAIREQCTSLAVVNLFAWKATNPAALLRVSYADAVGQSNDITIYDLLRETANPLIIAAWGSFARRVPLRRRAAVVTGVIEAARPASRIYCLGTTAGGDPVHPCRLPLDAPLAEWQPPSPRSLANGRGTPVVASARTAGGSRPRSHNRPGPMPWRAP